MTELEVLRAELQELNAHINRLPTWNDYAISCQNKYDCLLKQYKEKGKQMLYEDEIDYKENFRQEMLQEARENREDEMREARMEYDKDNRMRDDFDYFLESINIDDLQAEVNRVRKACDVYGWDFKELIGEL